METRVAYHPFTRLVYGDEYVGYSELKRREPEAAEHGKAEFFVYQAETRLRYGFMPNFEVFLDLPYKALEMRVEEEDEHHRNETLHGLGDVVLGGKVFPVARESFQMSVTLGLSLPTGRRSRVTAASYLDHDKAEELGINIPEHSHLQLGTGTFDPRAYVDALWRFDDAWMALFGLGARLPFYPDRHGYQTARTYFVRGGAARRLAGGRLIVAVLTQSFYAMQDHLYADDLEGPGGAVEGDISVPNTGRFEQSLQPSLTWLILPAWTFNVSLNIPVYTRIEGDGHEVQLTEPVGVSLGLAYIFGASAGGSS